jgi:hypothetical protein
MHSPKHEETLGIIFPVIEDHVERFFSERKRVFVKFFGREGKPVRLGPDSKLFIYQSGGKMEIVGEARIKEIKMRTADEVLADYGDELFLSKQELENYVGNRRTTKMLTLLLDEARRFSTPLKLAKSVTMGGQYMTKSMYQALKTKALIKNAQEKITP